MGVDKMGQVGEMEGKSKTDKMMYRIITYLPMYD